MDAMTFNSRQSQRISFFPLCTVTWRVNNYVLGQEKGKNSRKESSNLKIINSTVGINILSVNCKSWILKKNLQIPYFKTVEYFSIRDGNIEELAKVGSSFK